MNRYSLKFVAVCPSDQQVIDYKLTITTEKMIKVEDINCVVASETRCSVYHEELADKIAAKLSGKQVLIAVHQGVTIRTVR